MQVLLLATCCFYQARACVTHQRQIPMLVLLQLIPRVIILVCIHVRLILALPVGKA